MRQEVEMKIIELLNNEYENIKIYRYSAKKNSEKPYAVIQTTGKIDATITQDYQIYIQLFDDVNSYSDRLFDIGQKIEKVLKNRVFETDNCYFHMVYDADQYTDDEELAGLQLLEQSYTVRVYGKENND
ncbi:hypothetical protein AOC36_09540 [Erysipelothrix larvae]|uniref:Uncharacterized protein n=1 Tax=Erysipelothrix larvae TaxID=1514105 RepID=A0A109UHH0_9FIRM|nr:hypothetical protein [Erysipelothrix larvae]AMC94216.1 hypothetical protein AOC36_09540 [Erysipelothrix larvae]